MEAARVKVCDDLVGAQPAGDARASAARLKK
jgi:hypothetical protein